MRNKIEYLKNWVLCKYYYVMFRITKDERKKYLYKLATKEYFKRTVV